MQIKAIIFDWGRVLFDSETKKDFSEAEDVVMFCKNRGLRLAVASLVSASSNANLKERKNQIESSNLRKFFEFVRVTEGDKDLIFDEIVEKLGLPREEILIVDDRTLKSIIVQAELSSDEIKFFF